MTALVPFDWLEEVKQELFTLEAAPLLPPAPPFPVEALQKALFERLALPVTVEISDAKVIEYKDIKEKTTSTTTRLFSFSLSPHTPSFYTAIGHDDLNRLASWLLAHDMEAAVSLQGSFQESFYLFIGGMALDSLESTGYFKSNSLRLLSTAGSLLDEAPALSISCLIRHEKESISILILIPHSLQKSLKNQTAKNTESLINDSAVASKINIAARLVVDLVALDYSDIALIQEGSFLLLDRPVTPTSVQIVVGNRAFFAGKIEGNLLTITALAEPLEEIKKMDKAPDTKTPAAADAAPKAVKDTAPATPVADAAPKAAGSDNPHDPKYFLGEDEEFFVEDKELEDVLKKEQPASTPATAPKPVAPKAEEPSPKTLSDIPLNVEVVVGYMRLPIKELLSMQVGGTYTLGNPVNSQVDLLINGKRIAKGELLKSGDTLGVRILSL